MKFRILEQRGEFRIEAFVENANEKMVSEAVSTETRGWLKPPMVVRVQRYHKLGAWRRVFITDGEPRLVNDMGQEVYESVLGSVRIDTFSADNYEATFSSYKEAENYIWQEWGNQGWKAIEKPEWRQV